MKYTSEGNVTVEVHDGKKLSVTDTGIGISPEDLPRIFEKGYTGYNGRLDKKSTGIGLYLCRTAADKLGHKLMVESEPGQEAVLRLIWSHILCRWSRGRSLYPHTEPVRSAAPFGNRTDVLIAAAPLFSSYTGARLMELLNRKIVRA